MARDSLLLRRGLNRIWTPEALGRNRWQNRSNEKREKYIDHEGYMKFRFAVGVLLVWAGGMQADGQVVTGRSNTGPITLIVVDTVSASQAKRQSLLSFEIEFSEPSGNKTLEGRETGRLRVVVSNSGRGTVRSVVARVSPLAPPTAITFNDSILVGDIPVNASRYAIFYFSASEKVPSQIVTFQVQIFSRGIEAAEPKLLTFLTKDHRTNN